MSIQQEIDKQFKAQDENDQPIGNICISGKNATGSFKCPKGLRITIREGQSVTCSGGEGNNEVSFVDCQSVTVEDFKEGILRFERCKQVKMVKTKEKVTMHISDAEIQEMELKKTQVVMMVCKVMKGKFEDCEITSVENEYQGEIEFTGGILHSDKDKFQGEVKTKGKGNYVFMKPEFKAECKFEKDTVNLSMAECKAKMECKDTQIIDNKGKFEGEVKLQGKCQAVFRESEFKDKLETEKDGSVSAYKIKAKGEVKTKGHLKVQDGEFEDKVEGEGEIVAQKCKFKKEVKLEKFAGKFVDCEFEKEFKGEKGAIDSEKCKFKKEFKFENGNIESVKDEYEKEIKAKKLMANNRFYKPKTKDKVEMEGEDSRTYLEITDLDCEKDLKLEKFGKIEIRKGKCKKAEIKTVMMLVALEVETEDLKAEEIMTGIMDKCKQKKVEFKKGGTLILDDGEVEEAKVEEYGHVLAGKCKVQKMDAKQVDLMVLHECGEVTKFEEGVLIDQKSQIKEASNATLLTGDSKVEEAKDCLVNCRKGEIKGKGSAVVNVGGDIDVKDASTVINVGGSVKNKEGLTCGTGFTPEDSSGALKVEGDDVILMSKKHMQITSQEDSIDMEAKKDIILTATKNIKLDATMDITQEAKKNIKLDAMKDIDIDALGNINIGS